MYPAKWWNYFSGNMTNLFLSISILRINISLLSNKIHFNYSEAYEWLTIFGTSIVCLFFKSINTSPKIYICRRKSRQLNKIASESWWNLQYVSLIRVDNTTYVSINWMYVNWICETTWKNVCPELIMLKRKPALSGIKQ